MDTIGLSINLPEETLSPAAASVHEAQGQRGALPPRLKPIHRQMRVAGPAFPVRLSPGNNLHLHWAIERAQPGEVLVVDGGNLAFGYWGALMACAAEGRHLGGIVIDGGVRDVDVLCGGRLPIFASHVSIRGTDKSPSDHGTVAIPIDIDGVTVSPGDLIVGDADGVVVVAAHEASEILKRARERELKELEVADRLRGGETTVEVFSLEHDPGRRPNSRDVTR